MSRLAGLSVYWLSPEGREKTSAQRLVGPGGHKSREKGGRETRVGTKVPPRPRRKMQTISSVLNTSLGWATPSTPSLLVGNQPALGERRAFPNLSAPGAAVPRQYQAGGTTHSSLGIRVPVSLASSEEVSRTAGRGPEQVADAASLHHQQRQVLPCGIARTQSPAGATLTPCLPVTAFWGRHGHARPDLDLDRPPVPGPVLRTRPEREAGAAMVPLGRCRNRGSERPGYHLRW